jgi:hypothetical protein
MGEAPESSAHGSGSGGIQVRRVGFKSGGCVAPSLECGRKEDLGVVVDAGYLTTGHSGRHCYGCERKMCGF